LHTVLEHWVQKLNWRGAQHKRRTKKTIKKKPATKREGDLKGCDFLSNAYRGELGGG